MNPVTLPPFTYNEKAIGKWFWHGHDYEDSIKSHRLTIPKVMQCVLEGNNTVNFLMQPTACFNKPSIADRYNQGPYIDILSCSFKPLSQNACLCLSDSTSSTGVRTYTQNTQRNFNVALNVGFNADLSPNNPLHALPIGLTINAGRSSGTQITSTEFDQTKFQDNEKRIITVKMSTCYLRDGTLQKYKVTDLDSLIRVKRFRVDTLCVPPDCATSALGLNWELKYSFQVGTTQNFKWTTEVRTVFASNDWSNDAIDSDSEDLNIFGEQVHWIKTVHKIVQTFAVTIHANQTLSIAHISRKLRKICSTGYSIDRLLFGSTQWTRKVVVKENGTKTKLHRTNPQNYHSVGQLYSSIAF